VVTVGVHGSDVYVGGLFDAVGGLSASGIARWDGVKWTRLGSGVDSTVRAIAFDRNGDLYAGGEFRTAGETAVNGIARWDGSRWHPLGSGVTGYVYTITIDGDDLYAGGKFQTVGGLGGSQGNVARWDIAGGSWHPVGGGVSGLAGTGYVAALAVDRGVLYAGGRFNTAGGVAAGNIARWDGTAWSALGEGVNSQSVIPTIYALAIGSAGELYAGGSFSTAGGVLCRNIAEWSDSTWKPLGITGIYGNEPGGVYSLAYGRGGLYAGGQFVIADIVQANGIARWDGSAWSNLGSGMVSDYSLAQVTSVALHPDGSLYAGGTFTIAGGKPSYYFALWHPPASVGVEPHRVTASAGAGTIGAWPNPLSTTTRFSIDLPEADDIRLTISTLDGRALGTLIDARRPAGRHIVEWDASGVGTGTYLYTLRTSRGIESGRVIVVR
jgi:hypothetical protein